MKQNNQEQQKNYYMINIQKVLFIAGELHKRGYEKLRVVPTLSPSGISWRCSFVTESDIGVIPVNWITQQTVSDFVSTEIAGSIEELTRTFKCEHTDFLKKCLGSDTEYTEWYADMLLHLEEGELPYAYSDDFQPTDYWQSTRQKKIRTLPNERRFYFHY